MERLCCFGYFSYVFRQRPTTQSCKVPSKGLEPLCCHWEWQILTSIWRRHLCVYLLCSILWQLEHKITHFLNSCSKVFHFLLWNLEKLKSFSSLSKWWNSKAAGWALYPHLMHFPPSNSSALSLASLLLLLEVQLLHSLPLRVLLKISFSHVTQILLITIPIKPRRESNSCLGILQIPTFPLGY